MAATQIDDAVVLAQIAAMLEAVATAETKLRVLQLGDDPSPDQALAITLRLASLRIQRASRRGTDSDRATAEVTAVLELASPIGQTKSYAAWSAAAHVMAIIECYAAADGTTGQQLHVGAVESAADAELGDTGEARMQRITITLRAVADRFSGTSLRADFD